MQPSLSSADECTAVHVWAQSSLPGCVCAKVMMSVVSVRRAAARRCRCVGAAACAPATSASGAASKAGCRGALSLSGGGLEREGCIQAASDEGPGSSSDPGGPWLLRLCMLALSCLPGCPARLELPDTALLITVC